MSEEDTKKSTELMRKLSESQTLISINDKKFILHEMSIRRVKDFALKAVALMDKLQAETGLDISEMEVEKLITQFTDLIFTELTEVFNWIFAYKNTDYIPVSEDWVSENVSIRILTELVKEIALQNKLDWLGPFFKGKINSAMEIALR